MNFNRTAVRVLGFVVCVFTVIPFLSFAQELETPLYSNPVLQKYITKHGVSSYRSSKWDSVSFDLDSAEFFDDFSYSGVYPSQDYWLDKDVFVNSNGSFKPVSLGTAVFDGLNLHGMPYNPGTVNSKGSIADKLTSVPIDLSKYLEKDSIYLSFFYQPQGLGDLPETYDSLVLEFKPDSFWNGFIWDKQAWVRVWSMAGSALKPFTQVIIRVPTKKLDSTGLAVARFYYNRFQFRFANYGNLSGNLDHWHLDYVKLNKNRRWDDINYNDIAANYPPVSILKTYYAMPWRHLVSDQSEFRTSTVYFANNLKNASKTIKKIGYAITDTMNKTRYLYSDSVQAGNILPMEDSFYKVDMNTSQFPAFFARTYDKTSVFKKQVFGFSDYSDEHVNNDTSWSYQVFENYYAYDDGTPEAGYGISSSNYGQVAYHFKIQEDLTDGDSLRGVAIFFNQAKETVSKRSFKILVWKDYTNNPILTYEAYIDGFNNADDNGFVIFEFDTAIYIDGDFYIGWQQNAEFYLNVGLDKNYYMITGDTFPNKANANIHYNYSIPADWHSTSISGALMIRPFVTDKPIISGIEKPELPQQLIRVFPNPVNDFLSVYTPDDGYYLKLYDIFGKEVISERLTFPTMDVSYLPSGIYVLNILDGEMNVIMKQKLIKSN
jgi:hypothetical protein